MKLSLFSNLLLASLMVFAVACGKDSKKNNRNDFRSLYSGSPVTGVQVSASLTQYLDGVETNTSLIGPVNVVRQRYACKTKELLGISFLPYQLCTNSQITTQVYAQPGVPRKTLNSALADVLSPSNGYTLGAIVKYGNVVTVDHVLQNGSSVDTIQYTIDLSRHAVSNPVIIKDTANQRIDQVIYPSL